eukprot:m51a1_g11759 hypothetical protein (1610) ;mRNA; r:212279-222322
MDHTTGSAAAAAAPAPPPRAAQKQPHAPQVSTSAPTAHPHDPGTSAPGGGPPPPPAAPASLTEEAARELGRPTNKDLARLVYRFRAVGAGPAGVAAATAAAAAAVAAAIAAAGPNAVARAPPRIELDEGSGDLRALLELAARCRESHADQFGSVVALAAVKRAWDDPLSVRRALSHVSCALMRHPTRLMRWAARHALRQLIQGHPRETAAQWLFELVGSYPQHCGECAVGRVAECGCQCGICAHPACPSGCAEVATEVFATAREHRFPFDQGWAPTLDHVRLVSDAIRVHQTHEDAAPIGVVLLERWALTDAGLVFPSPPASDQSLPQPQLQSQPSQSQPQQQQQQQQQAPAQRAQAQQTATRGGDVAKACLLEIVELAGTTAQTPAVQMAAMPALARCFEKAPLLVEVVNKRHLVTCATACARKYSGNALLVGAVASVMAAVARDQGERAAIIDNWPVASMIEALNEHKLNVYCHCGVIRMLRHLSPTLPSETWLTGHMGIVRDIAVMSSDRNSQLSIASLVWFTCGKAIDRWSTDLECRISRRALDVLHGVPDADLTALPLASSNEHYPVIADRMLDLARSDSDTEARKAGTFALLALCLADSRYAKQLCETDAARKVLDTLIAEREADPRGYMVELCTDVLTLLAIVGDSVALKEAPAVVARLLLMQATESTQTSERILRAVCQYLSLVLSMRHEGDVEWMRAVISHMKRRPEWWSVLCQGSLLTLQCVCAGGPECMRELSCELGSVLHCLLGAHKRVPRAAPMLLLAFDSREHVHAHYHMEMISLAHIALQTNRDDAVAVSTCLELILLCLERSPSHAARLRAWLPVLALNVHPDNVRVTELACRLLALLTFPAQEKAAIEVVSHVIDRHKTNARIWPAAARALAVLYDPMIQQRSDLVEIEHNAVDKLLADPACSNWQATTTVVLRATHLCRRAAVPQGRIVSDELASFLIEAVAWANTKQDRVRALRALRAVCELSVDNANPTFRTRGLHDVTSTAGLSDVGGTVGLFADLNSDKFVDVLVVSEDKRTVSAMMWSYRDWEFQLDADATIREQYEIVNLAATDVRHQGYVDLLVTVREPGGALSLHVHLSNSSKSFVPGVVREVSGLADHPLLFDHDGDMLVDILAPTANGTGLWLNTYSGSGIEHPFASEPLVGFYPRLALPHSASFVDFDGDCHADLFLNTLSASGQTIYEIWTWKKSAYNRTRTLEAPIGATQVSFSDIDRDGAIDIVVPVCLPSNTCANRSALYVLFNMQKGVCGLRGKNCRSSSSMCTADSSFFFSLTDPSAYTVLEFTGLADSSRLAPALSDALPVAVHAGDFNLDGYPDLLVPFVNSSGEARHVQLWENVRCSSSTCSEEASKAGQRTFKYHQQNTNGLAHLTGAYAAAFFDLGEDGNNDIIVLRTEETGANQTKTSTTALLNNFMPDALFVKASGLNGVCITWCPKPQSKFPDPRPFGVNYPGGTWKFVMPDNSGNGKIAIAAPQLYHSGHLSLLTPYVMVGLGRVSNYLESVAFGVASNKKSFSNTWLGVIPNSQLVAIPYKVEDTVNWSLLLFISPSGVIFWVLFSMLLMLGALGGLLIYFKIKERKEDQQLREEERHKFDFNL